MRTRRRSEACPSSSSGPARDGPCWRARRPRTRTDAFGFRSTWRWSRSTTSWSPRAPCPAAPRPAPARSPLDREADVTLVDRRRHPRVDPGARPRRPPVDAVARVRRGDPRRRRGRRRARARDLLTRVFSRNDAARDPRGPAGFELVGLRTPDDLTLIVSAPGFAPVYTTGARAGPGASPVPDRGQARDAHELVRFDARRTRGLEQGQAGVLVPSRRAVRGHRRGGSRRGARAAQSRASRSRSAERCAAAPGLRLGRRHGSRPRPSSRCRPCARARSSTSDRSALEILPVVLAGRVVDQDEGPLANATVEAIGRGRSAISPRRRAPTAASRCARPRGRGPYQVSAHARRPRVREDRRRLRARARPARSCSSRAARSRAARPVGRRRCGPHLGARGDRRTAPFVTTLQSDGSFILGGLPRGVYTVILDGGGIQPIRVTDVARESARGDARRAPRPAAAAAGMTARVAVGRFEAASSVVREHARRRTLRWTGPRRRSPLVHPGPRHCSSAGFIAGRASTSQPLAAHEPRLQLASGGPPAYAGIVKIRLRSPSLTLAAAGASAQQPSSSQVLWWSGTWDGAFEEAKTRNVPILVVFIQDGEEANERLAGGVAQRSRIREDDPARPADRGEPPVPREQEGRGRRRRQGRLLEVRLHDVRGAPDPRDSRAHRAVRSTRSRRRSTSWCFPTRRSWGASSTSRRISGYQELIAKAAKKLGRGLTSAGAEAAPRSVPGRQRQDREAGVGRGDQDRQGGARPSPRARRSRNRPTRSSSGSKTPRSARSSSRAWPPEEATWSARFASSRRRSISSRGPSRRPRSRRSSRG